METTRGAEPNTLRVHARELLPVLKEQTNEANAQLDYKSKADARASSRVSDPGGHTLQHDA